MSMRFDVFIEARQVGELHYDSLSNQFAFRYGKGWLAPKATFALSPVLPLRPDPLQTAEAHSRAVRNFFENLLPEGKALDDIAATYAVSKHNLPGLFVHLGQETAGALRIVLPGATQPEVAERRPVSREELSSRIRERNMLPFAVWDRKVRLSIAGFQDKIAVFQDKDGRWFMVEGPRLASTYLVKPEPMNPHLAGLTSNEFFCMRLAKAIKLPVAEVTLHHVPEPVLFIERFDRWVEGEVVHRLPAIDGCQALGLPAASKYERPFGDGRDVAEVRTGASLPMLFALLQQTAKPAMERLALLRWVVFQVLIGNTDAHAKNLTFRVGPAGLTLAPAYDLVSGLLYADGHLEETYAMAIGDAFAPAQLSTYEWAQFAVTTQLPPRLVRKEIDELVQATVKALDPVSVETIAEGAQAAVVERLQLQVRGEAARLMTQSAGIPAMAKAAR